MSSPRVCRGVVTLEVILTFPIIFILFLSVIEFGMLYTLSQQVAFASRYGAKIASEEVVAGIPSLNTSGGGSRLRLAIDQHLSEAGVSESCSVTLQHNVGGLAETQIDSPATPADCECVAHVDYYPFGQPYVRVTVCVDVSENIPDLLGSFGFSIDDTIIEVSTTFAYEN
ncbi:MAG: pilus assembly protein [Planctomycetaceae bacterium]|nr:pilus assembly protein [Planctomycetaceae bacterium]